MTLHDVCSVVISQDSPHSAPLAAKYGHGTIEIGGQPSQIVG